MEKRRCLVYMRVGTAAQIVDEKERGNHDENLAQIYTDEKAARRTWPLQRVVVCSDGPVLVVQRWLHS